MTVKEYAESIKLSHSIFAMPFALVAFILTIQNMEKHGALSLANTQFVKFFSLKAILVIASLFFARSWAMGVNRIADIAFDRKNPRTATRALPASRISVSTMWFVSILHALFFILCSYTLSKLAGFLSLPVLFLLASYSYTKRFTWLCHYWLGACLAIAPLAVWVALLETFPSDLLPLAVAVLFWVSGFDILYSLQDEEFDKMENLNSIPARFGLKKSIFISRCSHFLSVIAFILFGLTVKLSAIYFFGVFFILALLFWQHFLVFKYGLQKIDMAFFTLNGWIAVLFLLFFSADIYFA